MAGDARRAAPTSPGVIGINHVAVSVSDLAASIAFYTEHFGLELLATQPRIQDLPGFATVVGYPEGGVDGSWALLAAGSDRVELVCYRQPRGRRVEGRRPPADVGLAHLAFAVDDVDALQGRLAAAGVAVVSRPVTLGRHRSCYVHGPDGELIELLEEYSQVPPSRPLVQS